MIELKGIFKYLIPNIPNLSFREKLRASLGALIGILVVGLISKTTAGSNLNALWLIAPIGASSTLLFAVPSSPFAQPWSILGGNLFSSLTGITCALFIPSPLLSGAVAVFISIYLMFTFKCVHPPSGAVALLCVIGGDQIKELGYWFVIYPLGMNTVVLVLCAIIYNKITNQHHLLKSLDKDFYKTYRSIDMGAKNQKSDLALTLEENNEFIDIDLENLERIFKQTQLRIFNNQFDQLRCSQVMSTDIPKLEFSTPLNTAWAFIKERNMQALPVLSRSNHLLGIVTRSDFIGQINSNNFEKFTQLLKSLLSKNTNSHSDKNEVVGQIMRINTKTVTTTDGFMKVIPLMLEGKMRHVPVIDENGKFFGMINQSDMIAALYQTTLNQATNHELNLREIKKIIV
jgi:CBS domain-containing membrane protein